MNRIHLNPSSFSPTSFPYVSSSLASSSSSSSVVTNRTMLMNHKKYKLFQNVCREGTSLRWFSLLSVDKQPCLGLLLSTSSSSISSLSSFSISCNILSNHHHLLHRRQQANYTPPHAKKQTSTTNDEVINIGELLESCIVLAQRAGKLIRHIGLSGDLNVKDKSQGNLPDDVDLSTRADREAERTILRGLRREWKGIACVAEEESDPHYALHAQQDSDTFRSRGRRFTEEEEEEDYLIRSQAEKDSLKTLRSSYKEREDWKVPLSSVCVFIDPLDATNDFTTFIRKLMEVRKTLNEEERKLPWYKQYESVKGVGARGNGAAPMVMIGISVKGQAVGGVLYQPFAALSIKDIPNSVGSKEPQPSSSGLILDRGGGRTIWGMKGLGAFGLTSRREGNEAAALWDASQYGSTSSITSSLSPSSTSGSSPSSSSTTPSNRLVIATSLIHSDDTSTKALERLGNDNIVLKVGGAGFKALLLLEGLADAFVFATKGTKRWDTCAPEAIVHSLGGRMTDARGQTFDYTFLGSFENCSSNSNNVTVQQQSHRDLNALYLNSFGVVACKDPELHSTIIRAIRFEELQQQQQQQQKKKGE